MWGFESLRNHDIHGCGEMVSYRSPKPLLGVRLSPSVPNAEVAQLVRASVSYAEGQRFDPAPRYKNII